MMGDMIQTPTMPVAKPLAELFRENVKRILVDRGIPRTLLAERLECSPAHVTQVLKSNYALRLDTVEKWALALDVDDPLELLRIPESDA